MESTSLSQKLVTHILENQSVDLTAKGRPKINGISFAGNGWENRFTRKFILEDRRVLKEIDSELLLLSEKDLTDTFRDILPEAFEELAKRVTDRKVKEVTSDLNIISHRDTYSHALPVVDMGDRDGAQYMVDGRTGRILDLSAKSWAAIMGSEHVKLVTANGLPGGRFKYSPRSLQANKITRDIEGLEKETTYNLFLPPEILLDRKKDIELDPRAIEFIENFFIGESLDYALNWIYHSIFKKMPTYLLLVGAGGTGKNLLTEMVSRLHGKTNFKKAPPSALNKEFNGHLTNCTLVYYDECKFSSSKSGDNHKKNRLKEWANEYVPVEIKNQNAKDVDIYCSGIISTNNDSDVHLEQLDRKFSVMDITNVRLKESLAEFMWRYIDTPEFIHALFNWLESKISEDFNYQKEFRGEKFNQLVISSLTGWQKGLRDKILSGEYSELTLKDLSEEIDNFPRHHNKISDFFSNFKEDGETLGYIDSKKQGKAVITINDKFCPKTEEGSL